uniref:Lengsin n=1 Tax=Arion vulgaris TaxID=1028688 RepID=A0A0B7AKG9_9EUPU
MAAVEVTNTPRVYNVDSFAIILVTACDIHGVPKGRFVFRQSVPGVVKNGLGMTQASLFGGILCDIPTSLTDYSASGWSNGTVVPDIATLKPLSWLSYGGQKVGHMLCDLLDQLGEREAASSREVALRQIRALKSHSYNIVTSYDLEFTIFHKGTLNPVDLHDDISKLVIALTISLSESGLPVVSVGRGTETGKLQISLESQIGIAGSDNIHQLYSALKSLCVKEGYDITLMTSPLDGVSGNKSSYCMTLTTEDGRNVLSDASSEGNLSAVARHWIAGLLHHNASVTAIARPTLNCYKSNIFQNSWTTEEQDRTCRLQVQVSDSSVSITDRLPSSASNSYTVLGALIAAGIDGIVNKLELPDKTSETLQHQSKKPASLSDALQSLEDDKVLQNMIGPKFVHRFLILKREFEVQRFENKKAESGSKGMLEFERSLYLTSL